MKRTKILQIIGRDRIDAEMYVAEILQEILDRLAQLEEKFVKKTKGSDESYLKD